MKPAFNMNVITKQHEVIDILRITLTADTVITSTPYRSILIQLFPFGSEILMCYGHYDPFVMGIVTRNYVKYFLRTKIV